MINLLYIGLLLIMSSCVTSNTKNIMNAELVIYPSGGGDSGYTINIRNDSLVVKVRDLGAAGDSIIVTNVRKEEAIKLSKNQQDSISALLDRIDINYKSDEDASLLDTWIYVIIIDNQEVARLNSLTLVKNTNNERLKNLQKFIKHLIKLSPIKLDLQSSS